MKRTIGSRGRAAGDVQARPEVIAGQRRILLVAAEQRYRDRLQLALERLSLEGPPVRFIGAENGMQAVAIAKVEFPHLVVIEGGVVPYGAFGTTRDLKSDGSLSCRVIIVLERAQDEWLARWAGADAFVFRPVDPFALAEVSRQLLDPMAPSTSGAGPDAANVQEPGERGAA